MSIYQRLSEAFNVPLSDHFISDEEFQDLEGIDFLPIISPWNKNQKGLQISPFKGIKNRYSKAQRDSISANTRRGMALMDKAQKEISYIKRDSCNVRRWMHNAAGQHKRIPHSDIEQYVTLGWIEGRLIKHDPLTGKFKGEK